MVPAFVRDVIPGLQIHGMVHVEQFLFWAIKPWLSNQLICWSVYVPRTPARERVLVISVSLDPKLKLKVYMLQTDY